MVQKLRESIMLTMFGFPKSNRKEVIPNGYIPEDKINYVLKDIGFDYLVTLKQKKIKEKLIENPDRDKTHGDRYVSIEDLLKFLNKYIHKYSDKRVLEDAVNYFDMDKDGQIRPDELKSLLNTFAATEDYLDENKIKEIVNCGKKSKDDQGQIECKRFINNINETWKKYQ